MASAVAAAGGSLKLLFVGRIVPHKGPHHLIATAGRLQEQFGLSTEVICPGRIDVSLRAYSDYLTELATKFSVKFSLPGEVDKEELDRFYREADTFVCLSEHEGFGLPIFEGMRSGLPTVALKQTAVAALIGTHPLAFSEFAGPRFAAAIATLREDDIRSYVLRYQDENILPQYTHRVVVSQILEGIAALFPACNAGSLAVPLPTPYRDVILDREINERIRMLTEQATAYSS